ncbi:MAG: polysaccharide deacetylase family protein [Gemmatimonadetes bacterium]|nr:polysaccharide deacetylase family protein [Gemmatimonadota bacterium]
MRPRRDPVPRARAAGHWLAGVLLLGLLAGGVVSAAVVLWENLDIHQLAPRLAAEPGPLPRPQPPPGAGYEGRRFNAALLRSRRNEAFYPDGKYYQESLRRWRTLIEATGGVVREVGTAQDLAGVAKDEVLIIPDAPCLSNAELRAVQAHVAQGGGVVSNWAVGARNAQCAWRGWNTVAELTGAPDVRELAARKALYLTVPDGTALSPGFDPGTRVELLPEPSLALALEGARVYWSDWALNPAPDESGGGADVAALAYRTPSGARGAWFGFRLSQAATPADSARLDLLVANGLRWAAGLATANVASWPGGRQAALVLAENVEAGYGNATAMADLLRKHGVRGSFYAVSQMVLGDKDLAKALEAAGEVGSQTPDHRPVAGLSFQDQSVRLRRGSGEVRGWTGVAPAGLRPPEETFDANTLRAWADAGGSYILAVNQARSASPEVYDVSGRTMVLLPRLIKDDYNVIVQESAIRTERLTSAFLQGIDKIRAVGGLAVVATHTQIMGVDGRLDAVAAVIDTARAQGDWWIAPGEDVAGWWKARSGVRVTVLEPGSPSESGDSAGRGREAPGHAGTSATARSLRVLVEAPPNLPVSDVWVDIVLPQDPAGFGPLVDGEPVRYTGTPWGIRVPVGDLGAGERRVVSLIPVERPSTKKDTPTT